MGSHRMGYFMKHFPVSAIMIIQWEDRISHQKGGIILKIYAILLSSLLILGLAGCSGDTKSPAASSASLETAALKRIHEIVPASETIFQEASALYAKGEHREALLTCDKAST